MKINKKLLNNSLKVFKHIVPAKSEIPSFNCVRLLSNEDILTVSASHFGDNVMIQLTNTLPCESIGSKIDMTIPLTSMLALTKGKDELDIMPSIITDSCVNSAGKVVGRIIYPIEGVCLKTEEFGSYPLDNKATNMNTLNSYIGKDLSEALCNTIPFVSKNCFNPNLQFVCLRNNHIVGCDGHRLAVMTLGNIIDTEVLLDPKTAKIIMQTAINSCVEISQNEDIVKIKYDNWEILQQKCSYNYVQYEKIIEEANENILPISIVQDKQSFISAIQQLTAIENKDNISIGLYAGKLYLCIGSSIIMLQDNLQEDVIFKSKINVKYLLSVLACCSSVIQLSPKPEIVTNVVSILMHIDNDPNKTVLIMGASE